MNMTRARRILFLCWFLSLSLFGGNHSALAADGPFLTGLRAVSPEDESWVRTHAVQRTAPRKARSALPSEVYNIEFLPEVRRQSLPNCGAFAPTYYLKTYLKARKHGWGRVNPISHPERATSPGIAYVFGQADVEGGSIVGSIRIMQQVGSLPLSRLPDSYNYERTKYPPARFFLEAMAHRAGDMITFDMTSDDGFQALKEWLADGEVAVIALPISNATFNYGGANVPDVDNDVIHGLGGERFDDHAFTVIGYDDARTYTDHEGQKQGAFFAVNSWGSNWGVSGPDTGTKGFLWIGYDYFRQALASGNHQSAHSMTLRDDPEPVLAGLFAYEHPHSLQVTMDFWGGDRDAPDWTWPWISYSPSEDAAYHADHPLVVNFTGDPSDPSENFWWQIRNTGAIPGLPHPAEQGVAHTLRVYNHADLLQALPWKLYDVVGNDYIWHVTPLAQIDAPYWEAEGLPVQTELLPARTDISVSMMDGGDELLELPVVHGKTIFADFNGNGYQDLLVVGGGETQVYENLGGTFRRVHDHGIPGLTHAAVAAADFNRDGLPDVAVCGSYELWNRVTRIYKNMGNFRFQDIGADLPGVSGSDLGLGASIAWGDYDNDGLEDLAFWGFADDGSKNVHVYRNKGDGTFESAGFQLPEHHGANLAWHDVTANGWLDLTAGTHVFLNQGNGLLDPTPVGTNQDVGTILYRGSGLWADFTGNGLPDMARTERIHEFGPSGYQLRFHLNQGRGVFTDSGMTIPNVRFARMAAGDYNNSGRMDLLSTHQSDGYSGSIGSITPRAAAVYRQRPDGRFTNAGFDLIGVFEGDAALADIDNDGALDVLVTGEIQTFDGSRQQASRLYRNRFTDAPLLARPNTRPTPPDNLAVEHTPGTGQTRFTWEHGSDAETPRDALAYNVRIGTWPGAGDISSPASSAPMTSTVRTYRLAQDQPGLMLRDLPPGYYYWSVRTVDGGRMASEWTPTQSFAILEGFDPRDVNGDGVFDVADLVLFGRMLDQIREYLPLHYDFNNDGVVNQADLRTLAKMLTGSTDVFPGSYTIGAEGGTVVQDGLEIMIPQGAIASGPPAVLTIEQASAVFDDTEVETGYRISGLPESTDKPLTIHLDPPTGLAGEPVMFVGEEVLAKGATDISLRYRIITPDVLPDGRLRIDIPAIPPDEGESLDRVGRGSRSGENTYSLNLGVLGGYAKLAGPRFSIAFPQQFVGDEVENLMRGFEDCYTQLRDDYGFSYARRTKWPVEVCVRDLGRDEDGVMLSSRWGDNYGTIEINSRILDDFEKSRATACHEFFHLVQGLYDPRGNWAKASSVSQHYWLDEAMSTWAEHLVVNTPNTYVPQTFFRNSKSAFQGVAIGMQPIEFFMGNLKDVMEYGYGMAPLPMYLVNYHGKTSLRDVYRNILAGQDPVRSLQGVVEEPLFSWYNDFFIRYITEQLYSVNFFPVSPKLILEPGIPSTWRRFPVQTPDLAGEVHYLRFDRLYPEPEADSLFAVRYQGDPSHVLNFFNSVRNRPPEWQASDYAMEEVKFKILPDARSYWDSASQLIVLVADTNAAPPYTTKREGVLAMGLARSGPFTLEPGPISGNAYTRSFPTFAGRGRIEAEAMSNLKEHTTRHFHMVEGAAWGGETVELTISYQADIATLSETWEADGRTMTLSTTGIQEYEIVKSHGAVEAWSTTSADGVFQVVLDQDDRKRGEVTLAVLAVYPLTYQVDGGSGSTAEVKWPLATFIFEMP